MPALVARTARALSALLTGGWTVLAKFGTVGAVAYLLDIALFNALQLSSLDLLHGRPAAAKAVSSLLAMLFAYTGNRYWAFRGRTVRSHRVSLPLFLLINLAGMAVAVACLLISRDVFGLTGPLADNIAANVVGTGLGTVVRLWAYQRWVFPTVAAPAATS